MEIKIKNIVKNFAKSGILKRFVLILFLTHLLLAHLLLQNYYLCFESDGNIVLESVSDKDNCCDQTDSIVSNDDKQSETCNFCEDVAVSENCDEFYPIGKNKIQPIPVSDLCSSSTQYSIDQNKIIFNAVTENKSSNQLDSYKTVLLRI
jgi:hypothetical protein